MTTFDGPLRSELLGPNKRLQQCAQFDRFHVRPGEPPSDHVRLIQEALRQVANASIAAGENYGAETTKAVVDFKTDRNLFTRGTTSIDPIVGTGTIRKLDELLFLNDERRRGRGGDGELGAAATIRPDTPISGECNLAGFSAARLAQTAPNTEWTKREPGRPIMQMVPMGQSRKLLAKGVGGASVSFRINDESVAGISEFDGGSVTLQGRAPGTTTLRVSVEGFTPVLVEIVVRAPKSVPVDVFHLGEPVIPGAAQTFQRALLPGLNAVYGPQAAVTFTAGTTDNITRMVMDGVSTAIDPGMPIFFSSVTGPPRSTRPTVRFADFQREARNLNAVSLFVSPNIRDEELSNALGRGGIRSKVAWFKIGISLNASSLTVPAHEIGHTLGLQHIKVERNETFLMHPAVQINNLVIPAETLIDLMAL